MGPLLLLLRRRPGGTPADLPDDLVDAVVARALALLVGPGTLAWFGTGLAPPGVVLPYAELAEPEEDDSYWTTDGDGLAEGHLEIACFAATKKAARAIGDRVAGALEDAPLRFAAGILVYLRQSGRTAALDPDPAPGGGDCWAEIRQFKYIYSQSIGG